MIYYSINYSEDETMINLSAKLFLWPEQLHELVEVPAI